MIIGCDLHTRYQQIAMLDTDTGEVVERRLEHENGEARAFYGALVGRVRVGIEATGHTQWFEAMLGEMGHGTENRGQTGRSPISIRRNTWKRSVCPRFPPRPRFPPNSGSAGLTAAFFFIASWARAGNANASRTIARNGILFISFSTIEFRNQNFNFLFSPALAPQQLRQLYRVAQPSPRIDRSLLRSLWGHFQSR
jgi:hypothetical protein